MRSALFAPPAQDAAGSRSSTSKKRSPSPKEKRGPEKQGKSASSLKRRDHDVEQDDRYAGAAGRFESLEAGRPNGPARSLEGWVLIVRGIHEEAQEDDVFEAFSCLHPADTGADNGIMNLHLDIDRRTGFAKGYALIEYEHRSDTEKYMKYWNGKSFLHQPVDVSFAFQIPDKASHKTAKNLMEAPAQIEASIDDSDPVLTGLRIGGVAFDDESALNKLVDLLRDELVTCLVKQEIDEDKVLDATTEENRATWQLNPQQRELLRVMMKGSSRFDPSQDPNALAMYRDKVRYIDVGHLKFTHDEVSRTFLHGPHKGQSVDGLVLQLQRGSTAVSSIPPLVVVKLCGVLWVVFGNRRLKSLKEFANGRDRGVMMACIVHSLDEDSKMHPSLVAKFIDSASTTNGGVSAGFKGTSQSRAMKAQDGRSKARGNGHSYISSNSPTRCFLWNTLFQDLRGQFILASEVQPLARLQGRCGDVLLKLVKRHEGLQQLSILTTLHANLTVTASHRVLVRRGDKEQVVPAYSLQEGEDVVCARGVAKLLQVRQEQREVSVFELAFEPDMPLSAFNLPDDTILTKGFAMPKNTAQWHDARAPTHGR